MSSEEKRTNLRISRIRYVQLTSKKEKGLFLDPFCCRTGLDRKHAIQQLRKRKNSVKRGHPRRYDMASRELLTEVESLSNQLYEKLPHAVVMPWLLRHGKRRYGQKDTAAGISGNIIGHMSQKCGKRRYDARLSSGEVGA